MNMTKSNNNFQNKLNDTEDKIHQFLYELLKDLRIVCDHKKGNNTINEIHNRVKTPSLEILINDEKVASVTIIYFLL